MKFFIIDADWSLRKDTIRLIMKVLKLTAVSLTILVLVFVSSVFAQTSLSDLEDRMNAVENYIDGFQPALKKFSEDMENSARSYNQGLESSLNKYYLKLQDNLNQKLNSINNRVVALDTSGKTFQRLDTDAGIFLVSIEKTEKIENGIRLHINIGNINFADFTDYKIKLLWGKKWTGGELGDSYTIWRQSLVGAEFHFQGVLTKGMWNPVNLDLVPANSIDVEFVECSILVSTAILENK